MAKKKAKTIKKANASKPKIRPKKAKPAKARALKKGFRAKSKPKKKKQADGKKAKPIKKPVLSPHLIVDKNLVPCIVCGGESKFKCQSCQKEFCVDHFDVCYNVCYECKHELKDSFSDL